MVATFRYLASDQIRFHQALSVPPRAIEAYRLLYVESGEGEFQISETTFAVRSGWLGLLGPGLRANHYLDTESVSYVFVEFASTLPLMEERFLESTVENPQRATLVSLLKTIDSQRSDPEGILLAAALQLLFPAEDSSLTQSIDPRLKSVVELIQQHPARNHTVSELAAMANLSEPHLRRLFRRDLHTSPKQFLLRERMEFAQRLLRLEGLRVGAVAKLIGFDSVYQFSAQYRRIFGRPPSADRLS